MSLNLKQLKVRPTQNKEVGQMSAFSAKQLEMLIMLSI